MARSSSSSSRRDLLRRGAAALGASVALARVEPVGAQTSAPPSGPTARGVFDVRAFGATGRREDNATAPCRAAVAACAAAGGGTVYVPPGEYTVGTVPLADNVALHLEAGATWRLSQSRDDFLPGARAMIFAENASNISLEGRGTIDGLAQYVFTDMRGVDPEIAAEIEIARAAGVDMRRYYRTGMQAYLVILNHCTHVQIRGVSLVHSPLWTVRLNDCDRVQVHGVYIHSDLETGVNADGIDIVSSSNVTVSDSVIVTADDAIVLKAIARDGAPARPVENVVVTNCILSSSSTPLMIGTETQADIRHVLFTNCVIRNSNKGFGINVQDGAVVSDVIVSHLTVETNRRHWNWWGSAEFCKLVLERRTPASPLGAIRDVAIDNVIAHVRGTSTIAGDAERPLENIRLSNVQLFMEPEDAPDKRASDALQITHVQGLDLRNLSVRWSASAPEPKWGSALALRQVSDYTVDAFSGRQGRTASDLPAIVLADTTGGTVSRSRATTGCRTLIRVEGDANRDLVFQDNRVPPGAVAVSGAPSDRGSSSNPPR